MNRNLSQQQQIERSLRTTYNKTIWKKFITAIQRYELIAEGDNICVCVSGGKDSMLTAKLMQELHKHSDFPFELHFLVMDPGYNEANRKTIEQNLEILGIPAIIRDSKIYDSVATMDGSPCYMCARMRRGHLYTFAQELGCNKIALGHHMNDVIETALMSMFYSSEIGTMMPKLPSTNFPQMSLIRPLYCVSEQAILDWKESNNLEFIRCACRFTESCIIEPAENGIDESTGSKRADMKLLIAAMKKANPNIEKSIFASLHNANLNTLLGYKLGSQKHEFAQLYDEINGEKG
ncbi:MAG: tRNA 2-thiocytidine biosynthesis protein TtcA [Clostridiales Family XIII bacterium]|jgi:tRNA(Ile)-lysidine synthase TilS/MesJ|nr:tRNA 2-thiocytidine biosynthesis protein TtcA [Clostridiales Family XIII bacterium]